MKIQVLGSGCPTCKSLYELTKKAVAELEIEEEVEYITDITKIVELGVMTSPVLAIDGKAVMAHGTNDIRKLKELISNSRKDKPRNCCGCNNCDCSDEKVNCNCGSGCC